MKLRKQRLNKQFAQKSKRCGTLSQICVILLFVLVIFYVTVASYLMKPAAKLKDADYSSHQHKVRRVTQIEPAEPKIDSWRIPKAPKQNMVEDKKYAPPLYDPHKKDLYIKWQQQQQHIAVTENDYSEMDRIQGEYAGKCPVKFPKKVPTVNEFPFICSNLDSFDVRHSQTCSLETCDECVPPKHRTMKTENEQTRSFQKQFESQVASRRGNISSLISHLRPKIDGPVILMVFNHGYAWLFYNLLCSLEHNAIDIKKRSIIVTTDRESYDLVTATGFNAHYPEWLGDSLLNRITKRAAASFALGAHKYIVSIQIALITDLIHMGYDVIMQDIDMIWYKSPIPYLMQPIYQNIDIQMSVDGVMGLRGPGNSGFFIIRSNCKTKLFMETMISLIGLIMTGRSDQMLWNSLVQEKQFRMMHFETLTTQHFISGFQVNIAHKTKRDDLPKDHFI